MFSARVFILVWLLAIDAWCSDESTTILTVTTTQQAATPSTVSETTASSEDSHGKLSIARRIIDNRPIAPKSTDFSPWIKKFPLNDIRRGINLNPPRVTEDVDETSTMMPKKTRTIGPISNSEDPNKSTTEEKDPTLTTNGSLQLQGNRNEAFDQNRGSINNRATSAGAAAASPRYHGNRHYAYDDRNGWRSSNYFGFGKDKLYDRDRYPYDRFANGHKPNYDYAPDRDRYGSPNRPGANYANSDNDRIFGGSGIYLEKPNWSNYAYSNNNNNYKPTHKPAAPVSGNLAEGDDYPFSEMQNNPPDVATANANLQTQKAVALKALAGVALIGAAAALASNPVLLPISIVAGKKKRKRRSLINSEIVADDNNYALTALLQGYIQSKPNEVSQRSNGKKLENRQELVITPECVARLACNVHRDYLDELYKNRDVLASNGTNSQSLYGLENWFDTLISSNILVADHLSGELKSLIRSAVRVGSDRNATCDSFSCLKNRSISTEALKLA